MTSAGKRKPRKARALVMDGALGWWVAGGAPLLPGYGPALNATDPAVGPCGGSRLGLLDRRRPAPSHHSPPGCVSGHCSLSASHCSSPQPHQLKGSTSVRKFKVIWTNVKNLIFCE